ncbi:MAG TPA: hypothetical protein VMC84_06340 [Methanocella sp.]|uniref:hypothetical protein n=1 Tax=Methanocella sp. TaxID=2052833 RepID=UPI002C0AE94C|nr:hypothetical protein [Methanocella sp.]HTY90779.1 hypothetical protein [Methanocella sp.]
MMKKMTVKLTGEELNERLDEQILLIERISIMLEDAKLDVNDEMTLDGESMHRLIELLSAYDAFLKHFRDTTEDTVATIRQLTTVPGNQNCSYEDERDLDLETDEEKDE